VLTASIFKANDIRGIVGTEWDLDGVRAIGTAYGALVGAPAIVLGRDMRLTSPAVHDAFLDAVRRTGVAVTDIGLASTDGLWFASGRLGVPGVQITSSHNPAEYNGLKFCAAGAAPVTGEFLAELARLSQAIDAGVAGTVTAVDTLPQYVDYLLGQVDHSGWRPLTVVVDAGNGMAGLTVPPVLDRLGVGLVGLYMDLDGAFPNHPANPLDPANLVDAQRAVREAGADAGFVFDGDADRVFVIDERGEVVSPSAIAAMIAVREVAAHPGATIVVNTVTSQSVAEMVAERGGTVVVSPVGHTYMKAAMAAHGAVFGGEHSAHYYFQEFFGADTGLLAALRILEQLGRTTTPLSALAASYTRYAASGEINARVTDPPAVMATIAERLGAGAVTTWGDGVMIRGDGWWVSVRPSNTEPLLRLNVEAADPGLMASLRDTALAYMKEE